MLSYRHAYHAGNHADVLKHLVLVSCLSHLCEKEKGLLIADTHAGAGRFRLDSREAALNAEYETGIGRLLAGKSPPAVFQPYLDLVRICNDDGPLRHYPGSPWLAMRLLRPQDRLRLFELHPRDHQLLDKMCSNDHRVTVDRADGLKALTALLPPPSRRALVLIDPSYEVKQDYTRVVHALRDARQRFANGSYIVWYPMLRRREAVELPKRLKASAGERWLHCWLQVRAPATEGFGMHGSGLVVVNPPWPLPAFLSAALPALCERLGQDGKAGFGLEHEIP